MAHTLPAPPSASPAIPRWPVIRNPIAAYSAAMVLTIAALLLRLYLDPVLGNAGRLAFFMFAATLSAFLFGQGPGIASTVVGCALGDYFFIAPRHSFLIANTQLTLGLIGVAAQNLIVCLCAGSLHRALRLRARAEEETRALYEAELRAHEAAADLNRTKDYFLAVLSHELRGPLSAIQYCVTDRLQDPAVPFDLREDFARIERSIHMQSRLITDLLDLTRLTRGKMEVDRQPLDLHALLVEAVRTCHAPGESPAGPVPVLNLNATHTWVSADRDRLLQVFWNILRNAGKFTARDGSINVDTYESSPGRIAVRIRDTGIGLSPGALERIFQPFEQAAQHSIDKRQGGLGLGLAIARGIMELHEGTLTGASDGPGLGTAFTVEMPTVHLSAPPALSKRAANGQPAASPDMHPSASLA